MTEINFTLWHWLGFILFLVIAIGIDLRVATKTDHVIRFKEACKMTGIWAGLAILFGGYLHWHGGFEVASQFLTGYIIELSLSLDNVFVFIVIFSHLKVPMEYQHRVLFYGVLSAIVMRLLMIIFGIQLFVHFEWLFFVFGIILIGSAIKFIFVSLDRDGYEESASGIMKFLEKFVNVTHETDSNHFFIRKNGVIYATPLFVTLLLIEKADLVFAIDSIPAVLAVVRNTFIVFTSNMFAILGLRSMYFVLENMLERFKYLKYGISVILFGVGLKMIGMIYSYKVETLHFLLFIVSVMVIFVGLSFVLTREKKD